MPLAGIIIYSFLFASLFYSWRAVTSISIFLLFFLGLFAWIISKKKPPIQRPVILFISAMAIQLLLTLVLEPVHGYSANEIALRLGPVAVPAALIISWPTIKKKVPVILSIYCLLLFTGSIYCLISSENHFYHELVRPLKQHAVYFSIYLLLAIFFLQQQWVIAPITGPWLRQGLSIYFSFFILLLSSKLVICFMGIYWLLQLTREAAVSRKLTGLLVVMVMGLVLIFSSNPIGLRFRDSLLGDPGLIERKNYDPGIYFNGIQLRMLQWKLVPEILSRKKAWLTGLGPLKSQPALNEAYTAKNMYLGDGKTDIGYRAFNAHNQLLESLLRYGIPGMLVFLFAFLILLYMGISSPVPGAGILILLIVVYSIVESVWETQYGTIIFCGLPFLLERLTSSQPLRPMKRL